MPAAGLLEQVGEGPDEAGERPQQKQDQRHAAPHLRFAGKTGLVRAVRP